MSISEPPHDSGPRSEGPGAARLRELSLVFLELGTIGFGGPAAHIALMRQEVVAKRGWLTDAEFLDYLGAANLIPGPTSTELAIHVGLRRAGWRGAVVAGASFILPAALIVYALAWSYVRYARLPAAEGMLYGLKPVVMAVVLQALWSLGRAAIRTRTLALVGGLALLAIVLGTGELTVLALAAVACALPRLIADPRPVARLWLAPLALVAPLGAGSGAVPSVFSVLAVFAKMGSVLFGSGYVLLAFLRADLVERLGWLTERQLLDAVAVGQFTPGPLFTTATFVGYLVSGGPGAVAATVGIFLPAFFFVGVSGWVLPRILASPAARAALDGVTVASLALMAVVTAELADDALVDPLTVTMALVSALLLIRFRVSAIWLIVAGGVLGAAMGR